MGIDWSAFTWDAFATLATGGAAVVAAYKVGKRQIDIQARQTSLQEIALRSSLFDKRYQVFENSRAFLGYILREAEAPDAETERQFMVAIGESRFLFEPAVHDSLDEIWKKSIDYHALKQTMASSFHQHGHYGDGNPAREHEMFSWFSEKFKALPNIFHQLNLGNDLVSQAK